MPSGRLPLTRPNRANRPPVSPNARIPRWVGAVWPWGCAALSGGLLALCFPFWDQGWLAWVALGPLIAAVWLGPRRERRQWLRDALLGYVAGLVFFSTTFAWLGGPLASLFENRWLDGLPPLLSTYLGLYFAFWAWFIGLIARGDTEFLSSGRNVWVGLLAAAAWVAQEWIRGWLFGGFGWNGLGIALHGNLALIQIADLGGVPGLSFLVAFANVIAVITVRRFVAEVGRTRIRPHWDFSVMMASVVGAFAYGVHALQHPVDVPATSGGNAMPVRIAAIQPDIPESEKTTQAGEQMIFDRDDALTHTALAWQPNLLLWPEAATLTDLFEKDTFAYLNSISASTDAAFILGSFLSPPGQGDFNIAACITHHGTNVQIYRKMHLVPFGEYIPGRRYFPPLAWIAGQLVPSDLSAGRAYTLFTIPAPIAPGSGGQGGALPALRVAPLICFEDTVGDQTRRFAGMGAQLLVNITNDSWFGESPGSTQHLANAVFRTIENRRPMVRDANTGITCIIDAEGRVTESLRDADGMPFLEGVLFGNVNVPRDPPTTLYMRYGDWVAVLSVMVAGCAIGLRFIRR